MVTLGSSARSRPLATVAPLLLALTLSAQARDDYALMEYAPMPALVYQGSIWCALADLDQRENYSAGGYRLFIHDFTTRRDSLVSHPELIDTVNCLAQNDRFIFAGGRGLSAFDKATRTWRQLPGCARFRIWSIAASESVLWLATDRHGVVRYGLNGGSMRRITADSGLSSNHIFSLRLAGDTLFAGPFRYGPEREDDWTGLGLNAIDVRTGAVRRIGLPAIPDPYYRTGRWLVTDAYPSPDASGKTRFVLWYPWIDRCWDWGSTTLLDTGRARPVADGVLSRCGCDADSALRTEVLKYLVLNEFTPETERLVAELADGRAGPRRFLRYQYQVVSPADYERVRRFYVDAAGFVLYREAGAGACCLVLEGQLLLYLEGTVDRAPQVGWRTHPRFELHAATNTALYQRLTAAGIACTRDTLSWRLDFVFEDPAGNRIRAVSDR